MARDGLKFEIDGPEVHMGTVDTESALALYASYLTLVRKVAKDQGHELKFHGLFVQEKCLQLTSLPSDVQAALIGTRAVSGMLARQIPVPSTIEGDLNTFRKKLRNFPQYIARTSVEVGFERIGLESSWAEPPARGVTESFSARGMLTHVGGKKPKVRLSIRTEPREISLQAEKELVEKIAPYLYKEVEIDAQVVRDANGVVSSGWLDSFEPVSSENPTDAWRSFYRQASLANDSDLLEDFDRD